MQKLKYGRDVSLETDVSQIQTDKGMFYLDQNEAMKNQFGGYPVIKMDCLNELNLIENPRIQEVLNLRKNLYILDGKIPGKGSSLMALYFKHALEGDASTNDLMDDTDEVHEVSDLGNVIEVIDNPEGLDKAKSNLAILYGDFL